jgi:SNF2 family DNA or RNA helicase
MDHFKEVQQLDTDNYWVLAFAAMRYSNYFWTPGELVDLLNKAQFLCQDETPFTAAKVGEISKQLYDKGYVSSDGGGKWFVLTNSTQRAILQDLLVSFPDELAEIVAAILLSQKPSRGRYRAHPSEAISTEERAFFQLMTGKQTKLDSLFTQVFPNIDELSDDLYEPVEILCGIECEESMIGLISVLLPPYPAGFLADIPDKVARQIVRAFAGWPQVFRADAHAELWTLTQVYKATEPDLVARVAAHWWPELPPGTTPDFWDDFPDDRVVADWVGGRSRPEDDLVKNILQRKHYTIGWFLRAVNQKQAKKITNDELLTAARKAPEVNQVMLDYLKAPNEGKLRELIKELTNFPLLDSLLIFLNLVWKESDVRFVDNGDHEYAILRHPNLAKMPWIKGQLARLYLRLLPPGVSSPMEQLAKEIESNHNFFYLEELSKPPPAWEKFLNDLEVAERQQTTRTTAAEPREKERRIIFIYQPGKENLIVREQTYGKKGWTPGRMISWKKFEDASLSPEDERVIPALRDYHGKPIDAKPTYYSYWDREVYKVDVNHALFLLAGHPLVFEDDKKRIPLVVEAKEAQLLVEHDEEENLFVRFDPPGLKPGYSVRRPGPGRVDVFHLSEEQYAIAKRIPEAGMTIPAFAADRLDNVLPRQKSTITVQSSTDWKDADLPKKEGSALPCFHLVPQGEGGHRVETYIKPLLGQPYYFRPGEGLSHGLKANEEEGRFVLVRNLKAETKAVKDCLADCPQLKTDKIGEFDFLLADDQATLEVIAELRQLTEADRATVEYPKGQRLKLGNTVDDEKLQVSVSSGRDWFQVDAALQLDEERVVDFEVILDGLRNDNKFIRVGEDEYLTITDQLRERLKKMDGLLQDNRGKKELSPFAADAFSEAMEGLQQLELDTAWQDNLKRMTAARQFVPPPPPGEFTAELRHYQLEGYEWLLRLASWGVGACLADDMGLGKTIQALAVLCQRAEGGAQLVIAPASVIRNWRTETERFAPTLNPRLIPSAAEAEGLLATAEPNDLFLVSFGLITYIGELLQATNFQTLVVDEAQAIKNATTKRARIVRDMNAEFKIATTGTPIENNLAELWSLFRLLNPGLFGSYARFRQQYETPIVKYENKDRAEQLRRIVRPFILRRRKDEVLKELPPKTEIVRTVDPSPEEKALYEALRRTALREIDTADAQRRRFLVLQHLTKLRQAACHPKLLRANSKVASTKLEAVGETIQEIIDGGHKALVFSQFVKHLKLVEKWVKDQGIEYQYLDGSTPGKKRQERVEAFQNGEGELFLISLKAGGTGLNLTAADYVLHLDPWWNPAAEDQASDRAHRIGQQRAVTVYRFVTAGTIEEQILELHATKRDLADQLLSGTDKAGSLGVDEVVDLLRTELP